MLRRLLCLAGLSAGSLTLGFAGMQRPDFEAKVLTVSPEIDGRIEPDEWRDAHSVRAVFRDRETGTPAAEPTEFWIGVKEGTVYFAVRVFGDPQKLQADEFRPNVSLGGNDAVNLSIEPFAKASGWNSFRVNPNGATQIFISGGRAAKEEWAGGVRARARITDTGWEAEMAVPMTLMELPAAGLREVMVNVEHRNQATLREYYWHFNNGNAEDTPRMFQTPIPARPARAPISLLPYGYAGFDFDSGKTLLNSGLDAKTQLGSSLTLIGTILPDFRNIENEVLSLDFSYFERLAGESRPFFQEGAGFLRVGGGGRRLFASQRIAEFDYGLNAYGSLDDRTSGSLLAAVNQGDELNLVASAERQLNGSASLSAAYVGRIARGRNNHAARVQSSTRFGDWSAYGNLNMTQDQTQGTALAGAAGLDYGGVGSRFGLDYTEVEAGFNPALGFWSERDFRRVNMGYNWERPQPGGVLLETEVGASVDFAERRNGDRYSKGFEVEGSLTFRNLADLDVSYEQGAFEDDRNHLARVNLEWPRGNPYRRWFVDYRRGSLAGRTFTAHQVGWSIRPWRRVQTGVSAQWVDHFEESRQTIFSANWDRGLYESIGGRLIERNGDINWHLSWRRSGGLGAEYFVIFGDPNARTFRPQLILKAVVPFELRF